MATLNTFFRSVLQLEAQLREKIQRGIIDSFDIEGVLINPERYTRAIEAVILRIMADFLEDAEREGVRLAQQAVGEVTYDGGGWRRARDIAYDRLRLTSDKFVLNLQYEVRLLAKSGMNQQAVKRALDAKWKDLDGLFREMLAGYTSAAIFSIQRAASDTMLKTVVQTEDAPNSDEQAWQWVTVGDLRVCKDCQPRHGEIHSVDEWERLGIPKSGFSVCEDRCRCMILPAGWVDDELDLSAPVTLKDIDQSLFSEKARQILTEVRR